MKATLITYYNHGDLYSDYSGVVVLIDGKFAQGFGDEYHDKGDDTARGFIQGIGFFKGSELEVEEFSAELTEEDSFSYIYKESELKFLKDKETWE